MTTKVCSKCQAEKTLDQFQPDPRYRLGVSGWCKPCKSEYHKVRNSDPAIIEHRNKVRRARDRRGEGRKYRQNHYEKCKAKTDRWLEKNMPRKLAWNNQRRAAKLNATPSWLSAIELAQIQEMYDVAAAKTMQTGICYQVDHIHPLKGNGFAGLHVPWNLRVITAADNYRKNNKPDEAERHLFWEGSF